jgi:hypothetical protein
MIEDAIYSHHREAAVHLEHAAEHHRFAAALLEAGDVQNANCHASIALVHKQRASEHAAQAAQMQARIPGANG